MSITYPSSPSNEPRMEEEYGLLLPANMLGMTSGKPRSRNKSSCCIPEYGKARATYCLSTSFPNIAMHMYQCWHVQNMFNINYLTNTHLLAFYLMQSNVPMLDYRLQWPALKQTMAWMVMCDHFEQAAAHLLPYDPAAKKRATGIKHASTLILIMEAESETTTTVTANETKPSIGKTGVHLCYHKHHEYKKLMWEQHCELGKW